MPDLHIHECTEYGDRPPDGERAERGNVVAVQPYMLATDYISEGSFALKVDGYLRAARENGWLGERSVVVLPEYLGTWLVASGEDTNVHHAETAEEAMRRIVRAHPLATARHWLAARANDRARYAVFAAKAGRMARIYHSVFSQLARTYGVTIVAGSVLLPSPYLEAGRLMAGDGPLYNAAPVYRSDGNAIALSCKVYPTRVEQPFVAGGRVQDLPVVNSGAGKLGVLVCADSWYPAPYATLRAQRAEVLAVVSYSEPDSLWDRPWGGYSGAPAPGDVDPADVAAITEREAWTKYAMLGRIEASGAGVGVNVFLRGRLWDLGSAGCTTVYLHGEVFRAPEVDGATLVNVWV